MTNGEGELREGELREGELREGELVIIGGGMAAGRLLKGLAARGSRRPVTVISAEPRPPYNRVLLPDLLAGQCAEADLALPGTHGPVRFLGGRTVTRVDLARRRLTIDDGSCISHAGLVLATGARVPRPDVPGIDLPGVHALRTVSDARALADRAAGADVCVLGGGLLGLETARSLAAIGARVHVVHRGTRLLNRQLDAAGAALVQDFLESLSIECRLGETLAVVDGRRHVESVRLSSGDRLRVQLVVLATGTEPNDDLARAAGLATDRGILASDTLATSLEDVFTLGECARVDGAAYAMVEPVYRQADVLADRLTGGSSRFRPPPVATRLKVSGLAVFAAGTVTAQMGPDDVLIEDPARRVYRRYCYEGAVLTGAVLIGDSSGSSEVQRSLAAGGGPVDPFALTFGTAGAPAPAETAV